MVAAHAELEKCALCGRARWWHLLRARIRKLDDISDNGHSFQTEKMRKKISTG